MSCNVNYVSCHTIAAQPCLLSSQCWIWCECTLILAFSNIFEINQVQFCKRKSVDKAIKTMKESKIQQKVKHKLQICEGFNLQSPAF